MKPTARQYQPRHLWQAGSELLRSLPLSTTLIKFLIVGGIGYVVNQAALFLSYDTPLLFFLPAKDTAADLLFVTHTDIRLFIASVIGVEAAIISNFHWHERWTFRDRQRRTPTLLRFLRFNGVSIGSPIIAVATVNTLTPIFGMSPYVSNTIGIALGALWNWVWGTRWIWPR